MIWDESWDDGQGNPYSQWIWAPELHKIGDYWYIISTAEPTAATGSEPFVPS